MDLEKAYKILGVSPTASDEELKKIHRILANKYHPDNYEKKSEEEKLDAKQKIQDVNNAYDYVEKYRDSLTNDEKDNIELNNIRRTKINMLNSFIVYDEVTLNELEYRWFYEKLEIVITCIKDIIDFIGFGDKEDINELFTEAKTILRNFYNTILQEYLAQNKISFSYAEKINYDCDINHFVRQLEKIKEENKSVLREIQKETEKYHLYAGYEKIKDKIEEIELRYEKQIKKNRKDKRILLTRMHQDIEAIFYTYFIHKEKLDKLMNISVDLISLEEAKQIEALKKLMVTDQFTEEYNKLAPIYKRQIYVDQEEEIQKLFLSLQRKALKEIKKLSFATDLNRINIIKKIEQYIVLVLDRVKNGAIDYDKLNNLKKITFSDFEKDAQILWTFKPRVAAKDIHVQKSLKEDQEADQVRWLQMEHDTYCIYSVWPEYFETVKKIEYNNMKSIQKHYIPLDTFLGNMKPLFTNLGNGKSEFIETPNGIVLYEYPQSYINYYCLLEDKEVITIQLLSPQEIHLLGNVSKGRIPFNDKEKVLCKIVEQVNSWCDLRTQYELNELIKRKVKED